MHCFFYEIYNTYRYVIVKANFTEIRSIVLQTAIRGYQNEKLQE